jgi:hypothetical protein
MKKILSFLFVLILLSPAMVWLIDLDSGINMERIGLKPPRLDGPALLDNAYYLSFDQYLNDSFSLRSPLIFAKRWLDYRLFKMTDAKGVHVGNNGWLYSRQSIEDYRKEACGGSADTDRLVLELHAIERIIEASGRRFWSCMPLNELLKPRVADSFLLSPRANQQFILNMWGLYPKAQRVIAANTICFSKPLDPTPLRAL